MSKQPVVKASEAQISRAIMDYLAARHVFAVRMNSGTTVMVSNGKRRAIHMNAPGTADILAFPRFGDVCWFEVKTAIGQQSSMQKSFQKQVEAIDHRYFVVRSVEDVQEALK